MRLFLSIGLLFVGLTTISARIHPYFMQYREGSRYFLAENAQGKLQIVDSQAEDPEARFTAETDVQFLLYTRSNPTTPYVLKNGDAANLGASAFGKGKNTKIIAHGWNNDGKSEVNTMIRDAFLKVLDVNVICVDWGKGSNGLYGSAVSNVPKVAAWTAKLLDWLVTQGSSVASFHTMGHSLGAHIAGQTARFNTKGKIPYVSAFDPAGPSWGPGTERIRPSDGGYVEIIHTNAGNLGIREPVGHNDFYPNEGSGMPGCSIVEVGCSHGRSYEYFAYSLDHTRFMANQCKDENEALNNKCSNLSQLHMGGSRPKDIRGIFHLKTNANQPYYQG